MSTINKDDIHSIARDWMSVNGGERRTGDVQECVTMYPDVNWTKEARQFLSRELDWCQR